MSTKNNRNRHSPRRRANNRQRPDQRPTKQTAEQIVSDLVQQFNFWCMNLRTTATFEFDSEVQNHRCKMTLPIFPNLQSIGNGAKTKKEAKANAIIAFLAHMEKRKQVGLFVPFVMPNLLRNIQVELRRASVSTPDLNININEYLLADRIISKRQAKKSEAIMKIFERICNVRIITLWQSSNMAFVYIVGPKSSEEFIRPFVKALFQPDSEQMFNYGEQLFDVFSDQKFLDDICQRLKVLCDNHLHLCKLFIRGSLVNVQICYNEFVGLRRELENELHRNPSKGMVSTDQNELKTTMEQLESTRIDNEEKNTSEEKNDDDQLPDYSIYDDGVNASMMRVLRDEEGVEEPTTNQQEATDRPPVIIELSDDSTDSADLQVLQTIEPRIPKKINQPLLQTPNVPQPRLQPSAHLQVLQTIEPRIPKRINQPRLQTPNVPQPLKPRPQPTAELPNPVLPTPVSQRRVLRHIVLDGQNIARNSNDFNALFSWSRLSNAINYFKNRGHENIIAFLPLYYRDHPNKPFPTIDLARERQIRDSLINSRYIAFTPSRYNQGHRLTNYDDRFILQYAADNDGVVVSNDNFRDLQRERPFQFIINNRILPFATINDTFMPATDPLGRNGPNLDEFLSKKAFDSTSQC